MQFNPGEEPPEFIKQMVAHAERHEMMAEDYRHRVKRLFSELNEEHFMTLRHIFANVSADETGRLAAYYEGVMSATAEFRFDMCSGCGVDHDKEAADHMTPTERYVQSQIPDGLTVDDVNNMIRYHLDDLRDEDTNQLLGFKCTGIIGGPKGGCGMIYNSIEDRMLNGPEQCSGCFTRAAHG